MILFLEGFATGLVVVLTTSAVIGVYVTKHPRVMVRRMMRGK